MAWKSRISTKERPHDPAGETPAAVPRMVLGDAGPAGLELEGTEGEVAVLECTVDDATPQALAFVVRGQGRGPAGARLVSAAKKGLGLGA